MDYKFSPQTKSLLDRLQAVECPDTTYVSENFPIVFRKSSGVFVEDIDRRKYLDFTSCFGVVALGHGPSVVKRAIKKQAKKLIHGMGDVHPTEEKIKLLELLAKISPYASPKIHLGLSGGDSIETALKTAMLATKRHRFLSFAGGYHGLQFGPLTLSARPVFIDGFESWIQGKCISLPFPWQNDELLESFDSFEQQELFLNQNQFLRPENVLELLESHLKTKSFAAIVVEPIQGRGGKREFPPHFLSQCARLCHQYGTLVILDEIYTGFGRTGVLFAQESLGFLPDLMCVGKALGGGFPLSACIGEILDVWGKSQGEARHTQTFLGHPFACHVAYENIREISRRLSHFQSKIPAIENEFLNFEKDCKQDGIYAKYPFCFRGKGFMKGLWFYSQREAFCVPMMEYLLAKGFLVLPEGERADVLSLTPPLVILPEHFRSLFKTIFHYLKTI